MSETDPDQVQAAREAAARATLLAAGADALPRALWRRGSQPPSAVDLVGYAAWRAGAGDLDDGVMLAALSLLPAARAEVDQVEAALLFVARAQGLSWPRISGALGLRSAQAAQQRFGRITGRVSGRGSS